jgi:small subunit ribosomal protein S16
VAVKIRLKRMGKIRAPYYRIVVADSRNKRDGRSIEEIGKYHPTEDPSFIEVDSERAQYWLSVGAQPSPQVEAILKLTGDWGKFKGDKNAKSTVKIKDAKVEFQADEKKKPVLKPKAEKPAPAPVAEAVEETVVDSPAAEVPATESSAAESPAAESPAETPVAEAPAETPVEHAHAEVVADAAAVVEAEVVAEEVAEAEVVAEAEAIADAAADSAAPDEA